MRKKLKVKKAFFGSFISDIANKLTGASSSNSSLPSQWSNLNFTSSPNTDNSSTPTPSTYGLKENLRSRFSNFMNKRKTETENPTAFKNLSFSQPQSQLQKTANKNVMDSSSVPVADASQVKTMSRGGSVVARGNKLARSKPTKLY